jgi:hypothetical protein
MCVCVEAPLGEEGCIDVLTIVQLATFNICSFVHQCNLHFLLIIIHRHVLASHGHLQVYCLEADALLCQFLPMSGCQPCASHVFLLMVCLLSVSVC